MGPIFFACWVADVRYWYDSTNDNRLLTKNYCMVKQFKIFFAGTGRSISTKLGMKHWGLLSILVYSNNDPGVTLTYLTTRSSLVI